MDINDMFDIEGMELPKALIWHSAAALPDYGRPCLFAGGRVDDDDQKTFYRVGYLNYSDIFMYDGSDILVEAWAYLDEGSDE